MSSKVLVTGGLGWLGSRLIQRLIHEKREIVCVNFYDASKNKLPESLRNYDKLKIVSGDIRKPDEFIEELKDCKTVFNCAALQHTKFTKDIYGVNRDGAANLLRLCIEANVPKFIHVSSCSVHGCNKDINNPITEETPLNPIHHIAKSKAEGERLINKLSKNSKIKTVILRPAVFYGTNPSKNRVELVKKIKNGYSIIFGENGFLRTYVDVEKVAEALLLAEKHGKHLNFYLIGDKKPINTLQFYKCIADEVNVKLKLIRLPPIASRFSEKLAIISGYCNIHLGLPTTAGEFGRNIVISSEKAIKELRYKPHESSERGLRKMARSVIADLKL